MKTRLPHSALEQLRTFERRFEADYSRLLGFPVASDFDYSELLPLMRYFMNNIGDPYVDSLSAIHSKEFEREVIAFFADLFRAPPNGYWGYITSGGTEGNAYALFAAREQYPEATVYYSEATHYSIPKCIRLLRMTGTMVAAQQSGEMDYEDLGRALAQRPSQAAIVVANIGTTMTEAKDNIQTIQTVLQQHVPDYFIHCDAALAGPYTALMHPRPPFDFADGADSISVSGHKFIGSPIPCGLVVLKKQHKERLDAPTIEYVAVTDTTILGSRSGHTALFLWYAIKRFGKEGLRNRLENSQALADYTLQRLQDIGWEAWKNPQAITVILKAPPEPVARKWQLATNKGWSHFICMPGVTKERVDLCIADLVAGP